MAVDDIDPELTTLVGDVTDQCDAAAHPEVARVMPPEEGRGRDAEADPVTRRGGAVTELVRQRQVLLILDQPGDRCADRLFAQIPIHDALQLPLPYSRGARHRRQSEIRPFGDQGSEQRRAHLSDVVGRGGAPGRQMEEGVGEVRPAIDFLEQIGQPRMG